MAKFKPGQSGNIRGRPKGLKTKTVTALARKETPACIKWLVRIRDGTAKIPFSDRVKAVQLLLEYGWGRPANSSHVQHSGVIDSPSANNNVIIYNDIKEAKAAIASAGSDAAVVLLPSNGYEVVLGAEHLLEDDDYEPLPLEALPVKKKRSERERP